MTHLAPQPPFHWEPQPQAQRLIDRLMDRFLAEHNFAAGLAHRLHGEAGVRFGDMLDFLAVRPTGDDAELERELRDAGFEGEPERMVHPGGVFPSVRLIDTQLAAGIKVDSVADFAATQQLAAKPTGLPGSRFRQVIVPDGNASLHAVERHGWLGFEDPGDRPEQVVRAAAWLEAMRTRPRTGADDGELLDRTAQLIDAARAELPVDWVCDLFFEAERDYWMRSNRAARAQYARQNRLGIGWANHDHHTYRSARVNIHRLVALFESLGLHCRESFTPGPDAGWGAQVMEQPVTQIIVFADVDMSPEEMAGDFAHEGLEARHELGTVGLWCHLHGDSILEAGMHHLECMFDFDGLAEQLRQEHGIEMMEPFSNFDHLKQQFTQAEVWPVAKSRLAALQRSGQITAEQADRFAEQGAFGSHMENLERNDGFKGFNQNAVTKVIGETDPRLAGSAQ